MRLEADTPVHLSSRTAERLCQNRVGRGRRSDFRMFRDQTAIVIASLRPVSVRIHTARQIDRNIGAWRKLACPEATTGDGSPS
jgi:hypothetical protein